MSTCSNADARGAGPSAAMRTEPGLQAAVKPSSRSQATADRAAVGSGPNSAAYVCGETVCPDAINLSRRAGARTLKPELSDTATAAPGGPRSTAFRMPAARVGGGGAGREVPGTPPAEVSGFRRPQAAHP